MQIWVCKRGKSGFCKQKSARCPTRNDLNTGLKAAERSRAAGLTPPSPQRPSGCPTPGAGAAAGPCRQVFPGGTRRGLLWGLSTPGRPRPLAPPAAALLTPETCRGAAGPLLRRGAARRARRRSPGRRGARPARPAPAPAGGGLSAGRTTGRCYPGDGARGWGGGGGGSPCLVLPQDLSWEERELFPDVSPLFFLYFSAPHPRKGLSQLRSHFSSIFFFPRVPIGASS